MIIAFLLLIHSLSAKTIQVLPPIQIDSSDHSTSQQRSVNWPVQNFVDNSLFESSETDGALNGLNGLQARTQGSPTFSIRGSAQSGRALVLIDDIPLNFSTGFGAPRIFLAKEMIQSVTLLKGPASLFYGSQALAGSINFNTKDYKSWASTLTLSDSNESFLPGRRGGLAYHSLHIAAPIISTRKSSLQASFFTETDDGQFPYQTSNGQGVRQFNSQNLSRLVLKGNKKFKNLKLTMHSILGRQILQSPGPINSPYSTREDTSGLLVSVSPHYFIDDKQSLRSRVSYLQSDSQYLNSQGQTFGEQNTWIVQNEYLFDIGPQTHLQLFADYSTHNLDSSFAGVGLAQDQFELGPLFSFYSRSWLKHQVGGRYLLKQNRFLPTLITHFYFSNWETWISYSQGFKNPTLSDLYSSSPTYRGNPDLTEERSEQWELGIKNGTTGFFGFDFRIFRLNYKNFLETISINPQLYSRVNQGQGYSQGVDLELRGRLRFLESYLRYNFLQTENQATGQAFRLSPKQQISLGLTYQIHSFRLEAQNTHWYETYDIINNQNTRLDDWQQWNFFVHHQFSQNWKVSMGLINAFNEGKELTLYYPEPQRRYWMQIRREFE